ncbi:MAG: hypothetical protein AUH81_17585 [Candidatus Rokubacteria bacterium 13_1_40CM_4_69_5]|nr:MAG: hypothetical protein AUH81_17585 [Candidatus Rokubacteria bacterium 13_1_40CM_4_69_5]
MMMRHVMIFKAKRPMVALLALTLLLATTLSARAAAPASESPAEAIGRTPPRLSYVDGEVSFWRPGAQDWAPAQLNTPLAPGDELYTGNRGNLELQVSTRGFVRAWGDTQLGLANQEPDFLQFKVTSGHVSLDLRSLNPGRGVELDTPHATFTIEHPGYYRVDVTQERTSFITRRAGLAAMTSAGGQAATITPSEEVVLEGTPTPTVQSYVAPELDTWDRWNYTRTDELLDAVSARYVSSDVYGVDDLDHYGNWRIVQTYGPVWVPEAVQTGWVPYSTGKWIWDPHYGWTWVDTAPWGWAPYHYGRWVFVEDHWAWAPGPVVVRPAYAPALVAFFSAPGIRVSVGAPAVSWVALSWGEPLVPWWGRVGFIGRPWWAAWGGPRVVNNVVINRTTVVNVTNVTIYKNVGVQNAVVAVPQDHFGRRPVQEARITEVDVHRLEPVRGQLRVTPEASSFVVASGRAVRPPDAMVSRPVVATRPLAGRPVTPRAKVENARAVVSVPPPRIVATPKAASTAVTPPRPPLGTSALERARRPLPPRFETMERPEAKPVAPRDSERRSEAAPPARGPAARGPEPAPPGERGRAVGSVPEPRSGGRSAERASKPLPGEPANRLFPGRAETGARRSESEATGERGGR